MAPAFRMRMPDWHVHQLPYYDSAFEMSVRPDLADGNVESKDKVDEKGVRGSFLKFMVTILKNYRQYLIYPTLAEPFPMKKFREEDYIAGYFLCCVLTKTFSCVYLVSESLRSSLRLDSDIDSTVAVASVLPVCGSACFLQWVERPWCVL
jgi:hypothetical protein